jgi:hypothetical protein
MRLGALQHAYRPRRRQGADVGGQLEGGYPAGEFDVEGGGREGVNSEEQRDGIEGLVFGEIQPASQLPSPASVLSR